MKNTFYALFCAFFTVIATAYAAVNPIVMGQLPSQLTESSGIDVGPSAENWSHNDGYGDNKLYCFSQTGALTRTLTISNAVNYDWEDITHDAGYSHMFIGDFGNNTFDRTNLRIYRIPYPSSVSGNTVTASIINFSYPDQRQFPATWNNFDAESFLHYNGNLYIFSKPDGNALGYSKLYRVPDQPGTYVATLIDSFYTNDRPTSVAINSDGSAIALIAVSKIHLFQNWSGDNFFTGQHTQINFGGVYTQKEATSFRSRTEIAMTDENNGTGNYLYKVDLAPWFIAVPTSSQTGPAESAGTEKAAVFPNPANDLIQIRSVQTKDNDMQFELYDITGNLVRSALLPSTIGLKMDVSALPVGVYYYQLIDNGRSVMSKRLVIAR